MDGPQVTTFGSIQMLKSAQILLPQVGHAPDHLIIPAEIHSCSFGLGYPDSTSTNNPLPASPHRMISTYYTSLGILLG